MLCVILLQGGSRSGCFLRPAFLTCFCALCKLKRPMRFVKSTPSILKALFCLFLPIRLKHRSGYPPDIQIVYLPAGAQLALCKRGAMETTERGGRGPLIFFLIGPLNDAFSDTQSQILKIIVNICFQYFPPYIE